MHSIEMDQLRKSRQIFDRLENLLPSLCFFFSSFRPVRTTKAIVIQTKEHNPIFILFNAIKTHHFWSSKESETENIAAAATNWHIEFNEDKLADKNGKSIRATVFIPQPGNFATLFLPFLSTIVYSSIASTEMEMHLISYFEGSFFV